MRGRTVGIAVVSFVVGLTTQAGLAQAKRLSYSPDLVKGKAAPEAAAVLLDGALQLAGNGSWERIAVGRAWYLGGDKARGQAIFDQVTSNRRVEGSDWFRIGRIYAEAGEWDKAQPAFERAVEMDRADDSGLMQYGALANVFKDREKAEELIGRAMKLEPREFWHWVAAGGSYLGVRPQ